MKITDINTVVFVSPQDVHWTNQCNAACSSIPIKTKSSEHFQNISYNFFKFNVMIMTCFSLSTRIRILVVSIESLTLWKKQTCTTYSKRHLPPANAALLVLNALWLHWQPTSQARLTSTCNTYSTLKRFQIGIVILTSF